MANRPENEMQLAAMETILPTKAPDSINDTLEAGFAGLELNVAGPDPGDDPIWSPANRNRIRCRSADLDIEIPSICLGYLNGGGVTHEDPDVRADARASILRAIDAAASLGADTILVPFFGDMMIESDREKDRLVGGISAVATAAEAADITLALENTLSGSQNVELCNRIDSPAVGVYYDVGNAIVYGLDPVEDIYALEDHLARVHFKDWDEENPQMIGEGIVDFPACVVALEDVGYDGWIVLETTHADDPIADAAENRKRSATYLS